MATRRGRPRSEASRQALFDAAHALVLEHGYGALTIDALARAAGVGKQTIYRWWASRADLVIDAILELAAIHIPLDEHGSLRADLTAFLEATFGLLRRMPSVPALLRGLMAEAQLDEGFRARLQRGLITPRRAALKSLLERAQARGELERRADLDLAADLVFGVMWYRLLLGHAPLTRRAITVLVDVVLHALDSTAALTY